MSYRDDLRAFASEAAKRRRLLALIVKITVCALALCFAVMCVLLVVDLATDGSNNIDNDGDDASGGADRKAPVITLKSGDAIYMYVGENIALKALVDVSDNSGSFTLDVDNSKLNKDKEGKYEVIYKATDAAGNKSELKVTVVVAKQEYSLTKLMENIGKKAVVLGITESMSTEQKVRKIYSYVNSKETVVFTNESNIPSINRDNWQTDWVEEAARTLEAGQGDCYSYYSLSKAFFEYFKIENVGIQRDFISSGAGTHFWSIVNIGTKDAPQWYYYDSTRLGGTFADGSKNACLITLNKLQSYKPSDSSVTYDFYKFDHTQYPTVSTKELGN